MKLELTAVVVIRVKVVIKLHKLRNKLKEESHVRMEFEVEMRASVI